MEIKVDINESKFQKADIKSYAKKASEALDKLWGSTEEKDRWLKIPINFDQDVIDNIDKVGLLIGGKCGLAVIVGDEKMVNTTRAMIEGLPEDGGYPRCLYIGETTSPRQIEKYLLTCRQNEIVVIGVSGNKQSNETVANFRILEDFVIEKYGEDKAKDRIYFVTGAEPSPFRKIVEEKKYSCITNTDAYLGEKCVIGPGVLLPMAIAGIDIGEFVRGCEDMVSDTCWDFDGTDYAVCSFLAKEQGCKMVMDTYEMELMPVCRWGADGAGLLPNDAERLLRDKDVFRTEILIEESDTDILLPRSKFYEEESIHEMMLARKEAIDRDMEEAGFGKVEITLERATPYNMGQLAYFLLISEAIKSYLK